MQQVLGKNKVRRPTINFAQWVFSIDLEGTREIQGQPDAPAYRCKCEYCEAWRANFKVNITNELINEFNRIGIDLTQPTECYGSKVDSNTYDLRATFYFVGKIRNGPDSKIFDNGLNEKIMNYVPLRKYPWLSVMVLPCRDSYEARPKRPDGTESDIVCIDIRLSLLCGAADA